MDKTPRKSPRLNKHAMGVDNPSFICSRPSDFEDEISLVRGKEKAFEGNFAYDSDFEDEISLAKRLRVNNDVCLKSQMATDHVKFEGFSFALQIWFYECCNKVDASIAIRSSKRTPHIYN
ncbi:hypothetical protein H5410_055954 [Solanum commersonii]|uniref:Uncharacterized protein n=1 Tax=Solanum commersonii TaxID=4109 RepID=A0A9J5WKV7_SOLCO|nr:hypothetical protein H5410_055954 [Solanum commersonii]